MDLEDVDHVPRRGEAASHSVPPLKPMTRDAPPVGHIHIACIAWISSAHLSSTSLGTGSAGPRGSNPDGEGTARNTVWRSALHFYRTASTEYRPEQGESQGQDPWREYPEAGKFMLWTDATDSFI